jgi:hypothetical protein
MNWRSTSKVFATTESHASKTQAMAIVLRRLPHYITCAGLGLLGGTVGVALAIGLAIVVQLLLPPPTVFAPGAIPLMVVAALVGLGASWLLGHGARRMVPNLLRNWGEQGLQVTLVFSIFTSLLQTLLFFVQV